jgi:hypothetical protein
VRQLARSLTGLEHPIGEAVLVGKVKVGVENPRFGCVLIVGHVAVRTVLQLILETASAVECAYRVLLDVASPIHRTAVVRAIPCGIVRVNGVNGRDQRKTRQRDS